MPRKVADPVGRRIVLSLILALLAPHLPGVATACATEASTGQPLLTRTGAILAQSHGTHAHSGHGDVAGHSIGDLVIESPWARESVTPTGAVYFTVRNRGEQDDRLIGVASDVADRADLHASIVQDGVMRMRHVDAVEVPAGGEVALAPGGLHVMLVGLKAPLEEGGSFPLTLTFEKAGEVAITVTIEDITYGGAAQEHGHGN
jgi:hypothetical protein